MVVLLGSTKGRCVAPGLRRCDGAGTHHRLCCGDMGMNDNDSQGSPEVRHLLDSLADIQGRLRRQLAAPGLDGGLRADILAALGGPSAAVLDALPAHVSLLDHRGVIVDVNRAWRRFADHNGGLLSLCGPGVDYLRECDRASADGC